MENVFIHPRKSLPQTISELAFFDAILLGLKHFTFLIKSGFRLGYGPVLDKDPHSTDLPFSKSAYYNIFWVYISDDFKTKIKKYYEKFCFEKD